ncbi:hypothetical protein KFU94_18515 [Chloroflexi bacterium TSY]|nr:hypothetical protein [Chloroflexi bacterium TSY]
MHTDERFTVQAWEELIRKWEREEITLEQLNGQMLVWMGQLHRMLARCEREQEGIGHSVADLDARVQELEAGVSS